RDLRVPAALRIPAGEGRAAHAPGPRGGPGDGVPGRSRADGGRRPGDALLRAVGHAVPGRRLMRPFERDGDCYRTRLTDTERIVLGSAVADVSELLSAGADRGARLMDPGALDDRAVAPEDPAVLRLLPD